MSGPASVQTVYRFLGPAQAMSKVCILCLKGGDAPSELLDFAHGDAPFVGHVDPTCDEAQVSGDIALGVVSSVELQLGDVPAFEPDEMLEELGSVSDPGGVHSDAAPAVVGVDATLGVGAAGDDGADAVEQTLAMVSVWADGEVAFLRPPSLDGFSFSTSIATSCPPSNKVTAVNEAFPSAAASHPRLKAACSVGVLLTLPSETNELADHSADCNREGFARTSLHATHPCPVRISWSEVALIPCAVSTSFSPCANTP